LISHPAKRQALRFKQPDNPSTGGRPTQKQVQVNIVMANIQKKATANIQKRPIRKKSMSTPRRATGTM